MKRNMLTLLKCGATEESSEFVGPKERLTSGF